MDRKCNPNKTVILKGKELELFMRREGSTSRKRMRPQVEKAQRLDDEKPNSETTRDGEQRTQQPAKLMCNGVKNALVLGGRVILAPRKG